MADVQAVVRVLDLDPDLAGDLDERQTAQARGHLVARRLTLEPGPWEPTETVRPRRGDLGLLVLEGLLARDVIVATSTCAELVGRGDLLRPWDYPGMAAVMPSQVEWHVLAPTAMALLDRRFLVLSSRWPEIVSALVLRSIGRAHSLAVSLAISCMTGLRTRLLALMWHLADRWGVVRPDGVLLPMRLTHQLIGRLIGASRPSVSTTLKELERDGVVVRHGREGWLLKGEPPEELRLMYDRRAGASPRAGSGAG